MQFCKFDCTRHARNYMYITIQFQFECVAYISRRWQNVWRANQKIIMVYFIHSLSNILLVKCSDKMWKIFFVWTQKEYKFMCLRCKWHNVQKLFFLYRCGSYYIWSFCVYFHLKLSWTTNGPVLHFTHAAAKRYSII